MDNNQVKRILYVVMQSNNEEMARKAQNLYYKIDDENLDPMGTLEQLSDAIAEVMTEEKKQYDMWRKDSYKNIDSVKLIKEMRKEMALLDIQNELEKSL